jgi:Fur family transcriptional regulator, ferric uptake regulator
MARRARVSAAVIALLEAGERHAWTLEELHRGLARHGTRSDFSSVFRAVEKLAAGGKVRKLLVEDGRARFELTGDHHDHLYCTLCHDLAPVPCLIARGNFHALERETGAAIHEHSLMLSCICRKCRSRKKSLTQHKRRSAA